eukprot:3279209-Pleurochrysis_carterae.AAC.1
MLLTALTVMRLEAPPHLTESFGTPHIPTPHTWAAARAHRKGVRDALLPADTHAHIQAYAVTAALRLDYDNLRIIA